MSRRRIKLVIIVTQLVYLAAFGCDSKVERPLSKNGSDLWAGAIMNMKQAKSYYTETSGQIQNEIVQTKSYIDFVNQISRTELNFLGIKTTVISTRYESYIGNDAKGFEKTQSGSFVYSESASKWDRWLPTSFGGASVTVEDNLPDENIMGADTKHLRARFENLNLTSVWPDSNTSQPLTSTRGYSGYVEVWISLSPYPLIRQMKVTSTQISVNTTWDKFNEAFDIRLPDK